MICQKHGETELTFCPTCMQIAANSAQQQHPREQPTVAPPPGDEIANDLIARARRLEKLSQQLAREANDLHYAAARIRKSMQP